VSALAGPGEVLVSQPHRDRPGRGKRVAVRRTRRARVEGRAGEVGYLRGDGLMEVPKTKHAKDDPA